MATKLTWEDVSKSVMDAIESNEKKFKIEQSLEQIEQHLKSVIRCLVLEYPERVKISEEFAQAGIYELILTEKDYWMSAEFFKQLLKNMPERKIQMTAGPFSFLVKNRQIYVYFNPDEIESVATAKLVQSKLKY